MANKKGPQGPRGVDLVKRPHQVETFTSDEFEELRKCADPVTGPMYFMRNYFYIQHPTKGRMLFEPFPYQIDLVDAYHNNRFCVAMLSRQTGKCLDINTPIRLRNKKTGEIIEMTIGEFYEQQSK